MGAIDGSKEIFRSSIDEPRIYTYQKITPVFAGILPHCDPCITVFCAIVARRVWWSWRDRTSWVWMAKYNRHCYHLKPAGTHIHKETNCYK